MINTNFKTKFNNYSTLYKLFTNDEIQFLVKSVKMNICLCDIKHFEDIRRTTIMSTYLT